MNTPRWTHYWPEAIRYHEEDFGPNSFEELFTTEWVDSLEAAKEQIRIWKEEYGYKLIYAYIARGSENGEEEIRCIRNYGLIKDLWADFADVPMNPETEQIEQQWGRFRKGTHREEIWKWFENMFDVSVGNELMGHEGEVIDGEDRFEIVDSVPRGFFIWNIGKNMPDGYLPLCEDEPRDKQMQRHGVYSKYRIDPDTLKAIRTDGAQIILAAVGEAGTTPNELKAYRKKNRNAKEGSWAYDLCRRIDKAMPYLEKIKWE